MTQPYQPRHACSRCGAVRTRAELNGYDPITGDFSQAYCRRLMECQSPERESAVSELLSAMASDSSAAGQQRASVPGASS